MAIVKLHLMDGDAEVFGKIRRVRWQEGAGLIIADVQTFREASKLLDLMAAIVPRDVADQVDDREQPESDRETAPADQGGVGDIEGANDPDRAKEDQPHDPEGGNGRDADPPPVEAEPEKPKRERRRRRKPDPAPEPEPPPAEEASEPEQEATSPDPDDEGEDTEPAPVDLPEEMLEAIEALGEKPKFRELVATLLEAGVEQDVDAVAGVCDKLRDTLPILKPIGDMSSRVRRVFSVMGIDA